MTLYLTEDNNMVIRNEVKVNCFDCKYCKVEIMSGKEFAKCTQMVVDSFERGQYLSIMKEFNNWPNSEGNCPYYVDSRMTKLKKWVKNIFKGGTVA